MKMFNIILILAVVIFGFQIQSYANSADNVFIVVKLEERTLRLVTDQRVLRKFPIRIGKKKTPTPVGAGYIFKKRQHPVFRYQDPPDKGKIIRRVILSNGRSVDVPYKKMRALGFRIYGIETDRYSIHSTSFRDTIGKAISNGCIGLNIEDMLELYSLAEEGMRIIIKP